MGRIIVVEFVSLDGVVEDPDGAAGTPFGGWAFRHGPDAVAGDKFRLGELMQRGSLLFGRKTWQHFSRLWPGRDSEFARDLNAARKLVVSRGTIDTAAWFGSAGLDDDLLRSVRTEAVDRDVVLIGSISVARELIAADLVDEYRLLVFPTVVGDGATLFRPGDQLGFRSVSSSAVGPAVLIQLERERT